MIERHKIQEARNELYEAIPTGEVHAFDLIKVIKAHINKLDELIDDSFPELNDEAKAKIEELRKNSDFDF